MITKVATVLALSLRLLSTASAVAIAEPQTNNDADTWYVSQYDASCANGRCQFTYQLDNYGAYGLPRFTAKCQGQNVPRGDKVYRTCRITYGASDGITSVQTYMELTPRRPDNISELRVQVGFANEVESSISTYEASKQGNYQSWRDVSTKSFGQFELYPFKVEHP